MEINKGTNKTTLPIPLCRYAHVDQRSNSAVPADIGDDKVFEVKTKNGLTVQNLWNGFFIQMLLKKKKKRTNKKVRDFEFFQAREVAFNFILLPGMIDDITHDFFLVSWNLVYEDFSTQTKSVLVAEFLVDQEETNSLAGVRLL